MKVKIFTVMIFLASLMLLGCSGEKGGDPTTPGGLGSTGRFVNLNPTCPSNLTSLGGNQVVQLDWEPPTTNLGYPYGYNIYRAENSTVQYEYPNGNFTPQNEGKVAEYGLVKINAEPVLTTHYLDTPLENGKTFYYRVRIVQTGPGNVNEKNHWSNEDYGIGSSFLITDFDPPSGPPGRIITGIAPDLTIALNDSQDFSFHIDELIMPLMSVGEGSFQFMTPPLPPGRYHARIVGESIASNTYPFVIEDIPPLPYTQDEFANLLKDRLSFIVDLEINYITEFNNNSNLYSEEELADLLDTLYLLKPLSNEIASEISNMQPEAAEILQCTLIESGFMNILNSFWEAERAPSFSRGAMADETVYKTHQNLYLSDQLSALATKGSTVSSLLGYASIVAAVFTGGGTLLFTGTIFEVAGALDILDYVIDTFIPTDFLDDEDLSICAKDSAIEIMPNDIYMQKDAFIGYPELKFMGYFRTQDKFFEATAGLIVDQLLSKEDIARRYKNTPHFSKLEYYRKILYTAVSDLFIEVLGSDIIGQLIKDDLNVAEDSYLNFNKSYVLDVSKYNKDPFPHSNARNSIELDEDIVKFNFDSKSLYAVDIGHSDILVNGYCMRPEPFRWFFDDEKEAAVVSENGSVTVSSSTEGWARTWGGSGYDDGFSVADDNAGDIYVIGAFSNQVDFNPDPSIGETKTAKGSADVYLTKYTPTGTFVWVKTWGGSGFDPGYGIVIDGSNNLYVTGGFRGTVDFDPGNGIDNHTSNGSEDAFLSKFDKDGNFKWARTWGAGGDDGAFTPAVDGLGNVYVTSFFGGNLRKFDPNGNQLWLKTCGVNWWSEADADNAGNVYLPGRFSGTVDFDPGSGTDNHSSKGAWDACLSKLDSNGNFQWARTWGGSSNDVAYGSVLDASGSDIYITGWFGNTVDFDPSGGVYNRSSNGGNDVFISKLSSAGNFQWARTWGGPSNDGGFMITVDSVGNVISTGTFIDDVNFDPDGVGYHQISHDGSDDAFLIKHNSLGVFQWARSWGDINFDESIGVSTDVSDNIFLTGLYQGSVDFNPGSESDMHNSNGVEDAFLVKLLPNGYWE